MRRKQNIFLHKLVTALGLNDEQTAKERLEEFIRDQKEINLLERIKAIRNNSYFIPDYNKPKAYTDIQIYDGDKPISGETRLGHPRPIDFGNNIKAWKKAVRIDHKKDIKAKQILAEREQAWNELIELSFKPHIMNKMMRID